MFICALSGLSIHYQATGLHRHLPHSWGGERESPLVTIMQLEHMDSAFKGLRPVAMDIFHLLGYVSLNMAGFRKMLKKYAKNVEPSKPQPGEAASTPAMSDEHMPVQRVPPSEVRPLQMRARLAMALHQTPQHCWA